MKAFIWPLFYKDLVNLYPALAMGRTFSPVNDVCVTHVRKLDFLTFVRISAIQLLKGADRTTEVPRELWIIISKRSAHALDLAGTVNAVSYTHLTLPTKRIV